MAVAGRAPGLGQLCQALGRDLRLPAAGVGQHTGGHLAVAGVGQHAGGHLAVAGVGQHAGGHLAAAGVGQHDGHLWQGLSWRWLALGLGCVRLAVVAVVAVVRASLVVRESLVVLPDPLTLEGAALELACGRVVGRQVTWAALAQVQGCVLSPLCRPQCQRTQCRAPRPRRGCVCPSDSRPFDSLFLLSSLPWLRHSRLLCGMCAF